MFVCSPARKEESVPVVRVPEAPFKVILMLTYNSANLGSILFEQKGSF